jgi:hypothetical protein
MKTVIICIGRAGLWDAERKNWGIQTLVSGICEDVSKLADLNN